MSVANPVSGPNVGDVSRVGGIALVVGAKAADVAISLPVLRVEPNAEVNPLARAAFEVGGTAGLLAVAVAVTVAIVGAVELGAALLDRLDEPASTAIGLRVVCYSGVSLIWWIAVANNVALVAGAL